MAGSKKTTDTTEERILELFQSRAMLKQEFNQLQKDKLLLTKIKDEHIHRIEFLESDLNQLEKLLTKPDKYGDIKVYYQLRRLWTTCNRYIHKFRDRLVDQQRDRERKQQLMEFNQGRTKKINDINKKIDQAKDLLDSIGEKLGQLDAQAQVKTFPWQFLSKQRLGKQRVLTHQAQSEAYAELQLLYDQRIKIESEPWPEFEGLDLAGKRSINLAMIALAQYFYMSLTELGLANKIFSTQKKRPWDVSYGKPAEQQGIILKCEQKRKLFSQLKDLGAEVQTRMAKLKEGIAYKKDSDSIPDPDSIIKLVNDISGTALSTTITDVNLEINVLTDNYWGLKELMIP